MDANKIKLTGRLIELGNLNGGSIIGASFNRGDGHYLEITLLTEEEARALAPAYDQQVTVTISLGEQSIRQPAAGGNVHSIPRFNIDADGGDIQELPYPTGDFMRAEDVLAWHASSPFGLPQAAKDVLAERQRQVEHEDWTHEHDDEHPCGEIAAFAALYAMPPAARGWPASETGYGDTFGAALCPADWQPKFGDRRRELVKAGALILAEIERLDRAAEKGRAA